MTVEQYEVHTGLLKELRELERQAAPKMGQLVAKADVAGAEQGPVRGEQEPPLHRSVVDRDDLLAPRRTSPKAAIRTTSDAGLAVDYAGADGGCP